MKLSTTTDGLMSVFGDEKALMLLAQIGFDAVDFSFFAYGDDSPLLMSEKDCAAYMKNLRAVMDESGIAAGQTHAPMPTYAYGADDNDARLSQMIAAIYASEILGAPYCVIHPPILPYRKYDEAYEENRLLCLEIYGKLLPHLRRTGVKLAVENMFNYDSVKGKICPTICSTAEEMAYYADTLGDCFVNCLDIGHTHLTEQSAEYMIKHLGHERLKCLHVHDNDGVSDRHTAPYMGNINWASVCGALKDIGYDGTFSFEADNFLYAFPPHLRYSAAAHLHDVGRYLIKTYIEN